MHHEEDEVDVGGKVIELAFQPLALRARYFVERAVENEDQGVGRANRIIAAALQIRKVLEVIQQRGLLIFVELVVAEGGEDRNLIVTPDAGLAVEDFPIIGVRALVDDVAGEADECRMCARDAAN